MEDFETPQPQQLQINPNLRISSLERKLAEAVLESARWEAVANQLIAEKQQAEAAVAEIVPEEGDGS